jgi:hypothetical protein
MPIAKVCPFDTMTTNQNSYLPEQLSFMEYNVDSKVFPAGEGVMLSIHDMLAYFEKQGALRVSDLHIKVGTQPSYRIDGDLVKLKGGVVTPDVAEKLLFPILGEKNIEFLKQNFAVDCSHRFGTIQFRITNPAAGTNRLSQ